MRTAIRPSFPQSSVLGVWACVCVCVSFHVACTNDSLMPASEKPWLNVRVSAVARHTAAHKARFQRGL